MNHLRELLDCFSADDWGDLVLFVLFVGFVVAVIRGWI